MRKYLLIFLFVTLAYITSFAQEKNFIDKCGKDKAADALLYEIYGDHWGYSYNDLLSDISIWENNEFIQVESIGQSTQGREMYELTISDFSLPKQLKHRIYIHARTHPGEVQAFRVTEQIINYLSQDTPIGNFLRQECIFHIVPMYNPDGVELEYPRENANGVDLESNWGETVPEIEVQNLRARFTDLMTEDNPVEIALNMHSAHECNRFFWVHHPDGTSASYYSLEEDFVESVRSHFSEGIMPYDSHVSWSSGNPGVYPESWWWSNHAEDVMALTYEDMNCDEAGMYDKTAYAILYGISDYLDLGYSNIPDFEKNKITVNAFPNPFRTEINIKFQQSESVSKIFITDILGREIKSFPANNLFNNNLKWDGKDNSGYDVPGGIYLLNIKAGNKKNCIKIIKQQI